MSLTAGKYLLASREALLRAFTYALVILWYKTQVIAVPGVPACLRYTEDTTIEHTQYKLFDCCLHV